MQESDATYDRRAFPLCRPTDCSKGAECERFKTEFINGAQRIEMVTLTTGPAAGGATLEYCLDDILLGMYPTSGVVGAPAGTHPVLAGQLILELILELPSAPAVY